MLAPVVSAQIMPAIATMRVGERVTFSLKLELGQGVPPSGPMPFWSSTNHAVIVLEPNGEATAVGAGIAIIEVKGRAQVARAIQVTF